MYSLIKNQTWDFSLFWYPEQCCLERALHKTQEQSKTEWLWKKAIWRNQYVSKMTEKDDEPQTGKNTEGSTGLDGTEEQLFQT